VIYDSLIGRRLDEYRLDQLLGHGGMARVYRALDVRLKRWVAIKVIDKPFRADRNYTGRFEQEAQAIAQLEHPHIVRLYRYGEARGLLYMVLQYIEGLSLDQILAAYREDGEYIEPEEASRIIREMSSALDYAHSKGVIHRDVKPSNIILNRQGNAILVDFGLALLADAGIRSEAFGTPQYIAPEQVRSSTQVTPQTDLYALGVILYEMFTGRLPFEAEEPLEIATLHLNQSPPPPREFRPEFSPALEGMILKALAKAPQDRYPSGLALANTLDRALQLTSARSAPAPPPTLSHLSIPEQVATSLTEHPLPPPAPELPPELVETKPAFRVNPPAGAAQAAESKRRSRSIYLALALSLIMMIALILGAVTMTRAFFQARPDEADGIETPAAPVATPPPPAAEPQLVADSRQDFSGAMDGAWEYLRSDAGENEFKRLKFEERSYGTCWYGQDYIRICPSSGHPGERTDVGWRWTSSFNGPISVLVTAYKIDQGGNGVVIAAYRNGEPLQRLQLGPDDTQGVRDYRFEGTVQAGDQITFVMNSNGRAENDHTAFQAQIYRQ